MEGFSFWTWMLVWLWGSFCFGLGWACHAVLGSNDPEDKDHDEGEV